MTARIVRKNHRFNEKIGGQSVDICENALDHRSTLMATMSLTEWNDFIHRPRHAPPPPGKSSVEMAAKYLEQQIIQNARDKERREWEKKREFEKALDKYNHDNSHPETLSTAKV